MEQHNDHYKNVILSGAQIAKGDSAHLIRMPTKNRGFTLVELAIALMVIGLLIGGVLKGQELIENAKVTSFIRQFQAYDTAVMIFRNTYNALPGDIKRPNRIPNCTDEICNIGGNGNGNILNTDPNADEEKLNFFPHLTKAGMIQGPEGGSAAEAEAFINNDIDNKEKFIPELPIGSFFNNGFDFINRKAVLYFETTGIEMEKIDTKMDDGLPLSGSLQTEDCATHIVNGHTEYDLGTDGQRLCATWYSPSFFSDIPQ